MLDLSGTAAWPDICDAERPGWGRGSPRDKGR